MFTVCVPDGGVDHFESKFSHAGTISPANVLISSY